MENLLITVLKPKKRTLENFFKQKIVCYSFSGKNAEASNEQNFVMHNSEMKFMSNLELQEHFEVLGQYCLLITDHSMHLIKGRCRAFAGQVGKVNTYGFVLQDLLLTCGFYCHQNTYPTQKLGEILAHATKAHFEYVMLELKEKTNLFYANLSGR